MSFCNPDQFTGNDITNRFWNLGCQSAQALQQSSVCQKPKLFPAPPLLNMLYLCCMAKVFLPWVMLVECCAVVLLVVLAPDLANLAVGIPWLTVVSDPCSGLPNDMADCWSVGRVKDVRTNNGRTYAYDGVECHRVFAGCQSAIGGGIGTCSSVYRG